MPDTLRGSEAEEAYLRKGGDPTLYREWGDLANELGGVVGYEPNSTEKSKPGCRNVLLTLALVGTAFLAIRSYSTTQGN